MLSRRLILTGLLAATAGPAVAQGKKAGAGDSMTRLLGIDGSYKSVGLNADGSSYTGDVTVVQQGDAVEFTWVVGQDVMHGQGVIEGRVVTVDWGDTTPVVYVIMPDGTLHGTWADGLALEKMMPN